MANGELIPVIDFAQKIKAKYPQYKDVDDTVLAQKMIEKYPQYKGKVDLGQSKKKENLPSAQLSVISGVPENAQNQVTTPRGIPIKISPAIPMSPDYAIGLQDRLKKGIYDKKDIEVVSQSMGVSPVAANAYMKGDNSGGVIAEFTDIRNKKKTRLDSVVQNANADLGLQDIPERVLSSPEEASKYIDKIEGLYKGDYLSKKKEEAILRVKSSGRLERGDLDLNLLSGLVQPAIAEAEKKALQLRNIIGDRIIEQVAEQKIPYDQKVKIATTLQNPRYAKLLKTSISDRVGEGNAARFEKETGGQFEILNADKAVTESRLNKIAKDNIVFKSALLEKLLEQQQDPMLNPEQKRQLSNQINALKGDVATMSADYKSPEQLEQKYPTLFKKRLAEKLNEFYAIKSGNVKGYEGGAYEDVDVFEFLRNNGFDPKDQRVVDVLGNQDKYLKDYSFFGSPLGSVTDVFSQAGKSVGDLIGMRDEIDRLEEKKQSEVFPTTVGGKDEYQLTERAKLGQLIGKTTGQVIGQGLLQLGTAGVGRMAGLSQAMAANTGFAASGVLTSFDQALKDSYDLPIDSKLGRFAYAGIVALANAATEKIFPEAKLFDIPGMKSIVAKFAKEAGNDGFTKEAAGEYVKAMKDKFIAFGKSYGKNIVQEAVIEEPAASLAESTTRYLFGDPDMNMDEAIKRATNTAYQTALGTSLIAGLGAARDMKASKNLSASSAIYNAALYPDEARDAIIEGFEQKLYGEKEKDTKIAALNTAVNSVKEMAVAEKVNNTTLTRPQREQYVANLTAEKYFETQKKNTTDKVLIAQIDQKIANLQTQRLSILANEVKIDDDGEVMEDVVEKTDEEGQPLEVEEQVAEVTVPTQEERVAEVVGQPSTETVTEDAVSPVSEEKDVPTLTKEAQDLIASVGEGSMPAFITKNLERIAKENGVEITGKMTAADVINALKEKKDDITQPKSGTSTVSKNTTLKDVGSKAKEQMSDNELQQVVGRDVFKQIQRSEEQLGEGVVDRNRMIETAKQIQKADKKDKLLPEHIFESLQYETGFPDNWQDLRNAIKKGGIDLNSESVQRQIEVGVKLPKDIVEDFKKSERYKSANPELVKSVEELLAPKQTEQPAPVSVKPTQEVNEGSSVEGGTEVKEGFTEGKDLNKIYAGLKVKYGDKKAAALYEAANRLVNPNKNTIVEIRGNGVVVKEGGKYILKPFGNTDANSKKWTLYKGLDVTDQFAPTQEAAPSSERAAMIEDTDFVDKVKAAYPSIKDADVEGVMSFAKETATDDPAQFISKFGEGKFNEVVKDIPTEELQSKLDLLLDVNPDNKGVDILDKIISDRETSDVQTERKDGLDKKQVDKILSALDKMKIDTNNTMGVNLFPTAWNAALASVKIAIRAGKSIYDAISDGLSYIFNVIPKKDIANFSNWVLGKSSAAASKISEYGKAIMAGAVFVTMVSGGYVSDRNVRGSEIVRNLVESDYMAAGEDVDPEVVKRAISIWKTYGRPNIITTSKEGARAVAFMGENTMDSIGDLSDFIAEMAHFVQLQSGATLNNRDYETSEERDSIEYNRVGSVEFDAHKIIEHIVGTYIMQGPLPKRMVVSMFQNDLPDVKNTLTDVLSKYKMEGFFQRDMLQKLDSLKIGKGNPLFALPPGINLLPVIWNGGIEVIKKAIQGGMAISDAIKKGIAYMNEEKEGQPLSDKEQKEIFDYISEGISENGSVDTKKGEAIFEALSKKSKAGTEIALEKIEGVSQATIAKAREINDNFDAIVKKLKEQNKLKVICP